MTTTKYFFKLVFLNSASVLVRWFLPLWLWQNVALPYFIFFPYDKPQTDVNKIHSEENYSKCVQWQELKFYMQLKVKCFHVQCKLVQKKKKKILFEKCLLTKFRSVGGAHCLPFWCFNYVLYAWCGGEAREARLRQSVQRRDGGWKWQELQAADFWKWRWSQLVGEKRSRGLDGGSWLAEGKRLRGEEATSSLC